MPRALGHGIEVQKDRLLVKQLELLESQAVADLTQKTEDLERSFRGPSALSRHRRSFVQVKSSSKYSMALQF